MIPTAIAIVLNLVIVAASIAGLVKFQLNYLNRFMQEEYQTVSIA